MKKSTEHLLSAIESLRGAMLSSFNPDDPVARMPLDQRKAMHNVFLMLFESSHAAIHLISSDDRTGEMLTESEMAELSAISNGKGKKSHRKGRACRTQETLAEKGFIFDTAGSGQKYRDYVVTEKGKDILR